MQEQPTFSAPILEFDEEFRAAEESSHEAYSSWIQRRSFGKSQVTTLVYSEEVDDECETGEISAQDIVSGEYTGQRVGFTAHIASDAGYVNARQSAPPPNPNSDDYGYYSDNGAADTPSEPARPPPHLTAGRDQPHPAGGQPPPEDRDSDRTSDAGGCPDSALNSPPPSPEDAEPLRAARRAISASEDMLRLLRPGGAARSRIGPAVSCPVPRPAAGFVDSASEAAERLAPPQRAAHDGSAVARPPAAGPGQGSGRCPDDYIEQLARVEEGIFAGRSAAERRAGPVLRQPDQLLGRGRGRGGLEGAWAGGPPLSV